MLKQGKRLYENNLGIEYGEGKLSEYITGGGKCLLQKNYGEDYDCTLTSLASMFGEEHYDLIESCAKKFGYNGKKTGTSPLVIKSLMQKVMKELGIKGKCFGRYGKGVSFNYSGIERLLKRGHKIVLNMTGDGRGYYKNHSVLIVGVAKYGKHRLLAVYDNWNLGISFVDYDKMCPICSINWYE